MILIIMLSATEWFINYNGSHRIEFRYSNSNDWPWQKLFVWCLEMWKCWELKSWNEGKSRDVSLKVLLGWKILFMWETLNFDAHWSLFDVYKVAIWKTQWMRLWNCDKSSWKSGRKATDFEEYTRFNLGYYFYVVYEQRDSNIPSLGLKVFLQKAI